MALNKFRPATRNANRHTQRGLRALDDSMRQDGYTEPMVAAADGEILSGSARLERAADVFGVEVEPIIVESDGTRPIIHVRKDIPNAQTAQAQRVALRANRVAQLDLDWDVEVIASMAPETIDGLWTAEELEALGGKPVPPTDDTEDETGSADERKPVTCPKCGHVFTP